MTDIEKRLVQCFQGVFPNLSEAEAIAATQDSLGAWDSMATVSLIMVIDDEFKVQLDIEHLAEMTSFHCIHQQLLAVTNG